MIEYGVDGFKFDGADACFYPDGGRFEKDLFRIHQARLYSEFATNYAETLAKTTVRISISHLTTYEEADALIKVINNI